MDMTPNPAFDHLMKKAWTGLHTAIENPEVMDNMRGQVCNNCVTGNEPPPPRPTRGRSR